MTTTLERTFYNCASCDLPKVTLSSFSEYIVQCLHIPVGSDTDFEQVRNSFHETGSTHSVIATTLRELFYAMLANYEQNIAPKWWKSRRDVPDYICGPFDDPLGLEPEISMGKFIERILHNNPDVSPAVFVYTFANMDRFLANTSTILRPTNIHRIFLAAFVVSVKFVEDVPVVRSNRHYARVGGISLEEMNGLEGEFLNGLQFNLAFRSGEMQYAFSLLMDVAAEVSWRHVNGMPRLRDAIVPECLSV